MRFRAFILILSFLFLSLLPCRAEEPVDIILFFSSHCLPCQKVKEEVLPQIEEKYGERIRIEQLEYDLPENYLKLLELQDRYNWHPKEILVPLIFINGKFLVGLDEAKKYLQIYIDAALSKEGYYPGGHMGPSLDLASRFRLISPLAVISAGLIDGINPCAFTVIIFFISFLTLQGYSKRQVLGIGISFILAVFLTYILIGLGLFGFLFKLKAYWLLVKSLYIVGAVLCFILAGLAFYDFVKFLRTRQTQNLVLQLPAGIKARIQRIIGAYYRRDKTGEAGAGGSRLLRLILSAFVVGCLVSLFEAVCTGQIYLPTIVFVLKSTSLKLRAFLYLMIYNLMFILPLWLILFLALLGVSSEQFSRFARRHMGIIKILMVILFLSFGIFLLQR